MDKGNLRAMRAYIQSFLYSTPIVIGSILISLFIGTLLSKKIIGGGKSPMINGILNSVIYTPHFVFAYFVYEAFGGFISLQKSGLNIVLAYVLKQTPFVVFYLLPTLEKIKKEEYETLCVMGASGAEAYFTAEWPRLFPIYAEITVILTSFIYTAYEIPALIGVTFPKFLGVLIYDSYFRYSVSGKAEAIKVMLIFTLFIGIFNAALLLLSGKYRYIVNKSGEIK